MNEMTSVELMRAPRQACWFTSLNGDAGLDTGT